MSDQARRKIEEILSDREYQIYYEDSQSLTAWLIERIDHWIGELLSALFPGIEPAGNISAIAFLLFIIAVLVVMAVIMIKMGRSRKQQKAFRDRKPLQSTGELVLTVDNHLAEAEKHEEAGEFTLAARHMFLALLLHFHEISWLEARIWKTNLEYYEELKSTNKQSAQFFYEFVLLFDQVTYGKRTVGKEEYRRYKEQAAKWLKAGQQEQESVQEG